MLILFHMESNCKVFRTSFQICCLKWIINRILVNHLVDFLLYEISSHEGIVEFYRRKPSFIWQMNPALIIISLLWKWSDMHINLIYIYIYKRTHGGVWPRRSRCSEGDRRGWMGRWSTLELREVAVEAQEQRVEVEQSNQRLEAEPHMHKLSIRPRQYSLSMVGGWKRLASIPSYSTRTSHVDGWVSWLAHLVKQGPLRFGCDGRHDQIEICKFIDENILKN